MEIARRSRRVFWLTAGAVFLITFLVFLPALRNGFVYWDDDVNFLQNSNYRGLGWVQLRWMFTTFHLGPYQPLSWMTLGADYVLWGMNPAGYHLTNMLLHALNGSLFYALSLRLLVASTSQPETDDTRTRLHAAAALSALLFSVHPLRVESVAWITERRDVLSGAFYLTTFLLYLKGRRRLALAAFGLSLLSKGIGVTVPLTLALLDIYPLKRLSPDLRLWPSREGLVVWREKIPFFLLAAAAGTAGFWGQRDPERMRSLSEYGILERLAAASHSAAFYLWKTVVPLKLMPLYELPIHLDPFSPPFALSAIALTAMSALLWRQRVRWSAAATAWAYYLLTLAPVSGLVQFGTQLAADRYTYLACLAWPLLAAGAWLRAPRRGEANALAIAVLLAFAALTRPQIKIWRDSESLWGHVLSIKPDQALAHVNLGWFLAKMGLRERAVEHYRRALQLEPAHAYAHNNLGLALMDAGKPDEALGHFRAALGTGEGRPLIHNNAGLALARLGRMSEAASHFGRALAGQPGYAEAHSNLGAALAAQGKVDAAIGHYRAALIIQPLDINARCNLALALAALGKTEEALTEARRASDLDSENTNARRTLAVVLASKRPF